MIILKEHTHTVGGCSKRYKKTYQESKSERERERERVYVWKRERARTKEVSKRKSSKLGIWLFLVLWEVKWRKQEGGEKEANERIPIPHQWWLVFVFFAAYFFVVRCVLSSVVRSDSKQIVFSATAQVMRQSCAEKRRSCCSMVTSDLRHVLRWAEQPQPPCFIILRHFTMLPLYLYYSQKDWERARDGRQREMRCSHVYFSLHTYTRPVQTVHPTPSTPSICLVLSSLDLLLWPRSCRNCPLNPLDDMIRSEVN